MWYRTQIGNMAIRRSISNQRLCSWRSNFFMKCISVSIEGIFLKLHIRYRNVVWHSRCTFGRDRSIMKHILPEKQAHSLWCLGFRWRDFPNTSLPSLYVNFLKTLCGCLAIIRIKVRHLNSCVTGRLCIGCLRRTITEYSPAITCTFAINSIIVVAISHILCAFYWNSDESSGGTSGCNRGMLL